MNAESVTNAVVLIICKQKVLQQPNDAHIADQQEEEKLFVATCFATKIHVKVFLLKVVVRMT